MASVRKQAAVLNEGCALHYWTQGAGPLIMFVPGGNGHGEQFFPIMAALSDRFTCATFDRRGMSGSKFDVKRRMNTPQQVRDVVAVIKAVGFEKAIIFGSSAGGILGVGLAVEYPDMVDHLITHESPIFNITPGYSKLFEWFLHILDVRDSQGWKAAHSMFIGEFVGLETAEEWRNKPRAITSEANQEQYLMYELESWLAFSPDLSRVKANGTSMGVMRGVGSGDAFYAKATEDLARFMECPKYDVPGHHGGFESETEAFLPHLFKMLDELEERRRGVTKAQ
jgi:pimeloyl-ACP methyl ester carboxylesterase